MRIGTDSRFDDDRYWSFTRSTGLPRDAFGPTREQRAQRRERALVAVLTIIVAAVMLGVSL